MYLTKRQREVLDFINDFIAQKGYSPSLSEIGDGVGLSSLATIHKHLRNLEGKGVIKRGWNRGRSIEMVPMDSMVGQSMSQVIELPIYGLVAAGRPIAAIAEGQPETMCIPSRFARSRAETFLLKVQGDSMIDEQIRSGDYIIVEKRETALDGETVVALIDDEEATVKRFYQEPGGIARLQPANELLSPMRYRASRVRIQGVVVGLMRQYA
jgi:repressor LexA